MNVRLRSLRGGLCEPLQIDRTGIAAEGELTVIPPAEAMVKVDAGVQPTRCVAMLPSKAGRTILAAAQFGRHVETRFDESGFDTVRILKNGFAALTSGRRKTADAYSGHGADRPQRYCDQQFPAAAISSSVTHQAAELILPRSAARAECGCRSFVFNGPRESASVDFRFWVRFVIFVFQPERRVSISSG